MFINSVLKKNCNNIKKSRTTDNTYQIGGVDTRGAAAIFKVTVNLEAVCVAASIGVNPVHTCKRSEELGLSTHPAKKKKTIVSNIIIL